MDKVLTEGCLSLLTDKSLVLSQDIEVQLEVRPISDSGLLLHAGTTVDQHLSLVLSQGEVTQLCCTKESHERKTIITGLQKAEVFRVGVCVGGCARACM